MATCDLHSRHPQAWGSRSLGPGSQGWLSAVLQEGSGRQRNSPPGSGPKDLERLGGRPAWTNGKENTKPCVFILLLIHRAAEALIETRCGKRLKFQRLGLIRLRPPTPILAPQIPCFIEFGDQRQESPDIGLGGQGGPSWSDPLIWMWEAPTSWVFPECRQPHPHVFSPVPQPEIPQPSLLTDASETGLLLGVWA